MQPSKKHPPNWRDPTIRVTYKNGGGSAPSNYRPICPTHAGRPSDEQACIRPTLHAAPRLTVKTHSLPAAPTEKPPSGTRHFGSQPWTPRRHLTQYNTAEIGGLYVRKASRSHATLPQASSRHTHGRRKQTKCSVSSIHPRLTSIVTSFGIDGLTTLSFSM